MSDLLTITQNVKVAGSCDNALTANSVVSKISIPNVGSNRSEKRDNYGLSTSDTTNCDFTDCVLLKDGIKVPESATVTYYGKETVFSAAGTNYYGYSEEFQTQCSIASGETKTSIKYTVEYANRCDDTIKIDNNVIT